MLIQLLLLQHHLDIPRGMVDLARRGIDVGVEVELHGVGALFGFRVALEVEGGGLEVEFDFPFRHVGHGDGEEDVVFCVFGGGAALGPCDCEVKVCQLNGFCDWDGAGDGGAM